MKLTNKSKIIILITFLILMGISIFLFFYQSDTRNLYKKLNIEETNATKLAIDWSILLNYFDEKDKIDSYYFKIDELYYYISSDTNDFAIVMKYYLTQDKNDKKLLQMAVLADEDNAENVKPSYIKMLNDDFFVAFSELLNIRSDFEKMNVDNSFPEGSVFQKISDKKLKIINKIVSKKISDEELSEKIQRYTSIINTEK